MNTKGNQLLSLMEDYRHGHLTRREFIKFALALGVGSVAIPTLLSAAARPVSAASSRTDELIIAAPTTPPGFDLEALFGHEVYDHQKNLNDTLTQFKRIPADRTTDPLQRATTRGGWDIDWQASNVEQIVVPRMLRSWDVSADGRVYTLHLRRGWLSHAGNELTASDVKWYFDRTFALKATGSFQNQVARIARKEDVRVLDRYTVQVRLQGPTPDFLLGTSLFIRSIPDSVEARKHATSDDPWATKWMKTHVVGFGPYKLEKLTPGVEVVWTAHSRHPFPASIKRVVFKQIPSSAVRAALLARGEIDVAQFVTPRELETLGKTRNVRVWSFQGYVFMGSPMNPDFPPLDKVKVRQALSYAVPYEGIVRSVYRGFARPALGIFSDKMAGYDPSMFPYKTDYAKASQLLTEAGHGQGFSTTFAYTTADPVAELVGVQLRSSFARIGVKLNLKAMPPAKYTESLFGGKEPMIYFSLGLDVPDTHYYLDIFYRSTSPLNIGHYKGSKEIDRLIAQGSDILNWQRRVEFHQRIAKMVVDDAAWLWIAQPGFHVSTRANVTGVNWYVGEAVDWSLVKKI